MCRYFRVSERRHVNPRCRHDDGCVWGGDVIDFHCDVTRTCEEFGYEVVVFVEVDERFFVHNFFCYDCVDQIDKASNLEQIFGMSE